MARRRPRPARSRSNDPHAATYADKCGGGSLNFHSAPPFRPRTRTGNADRQRLFRCVLRPSHRAPSCIRRRRTQRSASENSAARAGRPPPSGCRVGRPRRPAARCRARAGSSREQTLRKKYQAKSFHFSSIIRNFTYERRERSPVPARAAIPVRILPTL